MDAPMAGDLFTVALAVIGLVILISTLLSSLLSRSAFPQVAVFLLLGAALGPLGAGIFGTALDSPFLRVAATLSLALVLFTDAMTLDLAELRKHASLVARILGPGTLVPAGLMALAGWWLLGLAPASAAILGAALASTDPVLLRGLLRRPDIPKEARLALRLESGLNDAVLLPIVIVSMMLLEGTAGPSWRSVGLGLFLFGPLAGVAVGYGAVSLLERVRRRGAVRRDLESIYSLGVALSAFALAESFHASGFLAAFAAGLTILWLDVELCDCFVEYGETTAEMLLLFTFVLLGTGPIWEGLSQVDGRTVLFVAIALAVRPVVIYLSLAGTSIDPASRRLVSWYGPRGLSTLLLVLLPVFAGLPGMTVLFQVCSLVVLVSISLHGGSLMWSAARAPEAAPAPLPVPPRTPPAPERMTLDDLARLEQNGEPVALADARTARSAADSPLQAAGALRIDPDDAVGSATRLDLARDRWIAVYCG